jgi:DNA mismatch endonuclease (patch repair protein)
MPKSNVAFWENKFRENMERDVKVLEKLRTLGWSVEVIWECETARPAELSARLLSFLGERK